MKNYFYLQLKKVARILPFVTVLTLVLLIGLGIVLYGFLDMFSNREENQRYIVAVTGDTDNEYLRLGMAAMKHFDETRFSMEFAPMTEEKAKSDLSSGKVAAYINIPEGFVEKALSGDIEPITFVTSAGMEGMNGLFKKEITALVTDMVVRSQQGAYGTYDALYNNGLESEASVPIDKISIDYSELIFERNKLYTVSELGVSDGLSTPEYYVCAIIVLLLVLVGLPFNVVYIKKDYALNRLLVSRGYSTVKQVVFEYLAHFLAVLVQLAIIIAAIVIAVSNMPSVIDFDTLRQTMPDMILKTIPVVIMISAFNMMMFELADNIVSGLLLHFFTAIGLCYVSGCLYPIYAFPTAIKAIAPFLPTGIARSYLASGFVYESSLNNLGGLILYSLVFLGLTWLTRFCKTVKMRG